jgi:nicotinamide riboside kinase
LRRRRDEQSGADRDPRRGIDRQVDAGRRFLFCDTTPLMTAVYSMQYWGRVDAQLQALADRHDYAFTLVSAPDLPWEPDGLQRDSDAVRQNVHRLLVEALDKRGIPFTLVRGGLTQRLRQAEDLLGPRLV